MVMNPDHMASEGTEGPAKRHKQVGVCCNGTAKPFVGSRQTGTHCDGSLARRTLCTILPPMSMSDLLSPVLNRMFEPPDFF